MYATHLECGNSDILTHFILLQAVKVDPYDAGLFSSRSLCWLRTGDGKRALQDAVRCKMLCPKWAKAYHRQGQALILLKVRLKTQGVALVVCNWIWHFIISLISRILTGHALSIVFLRSMKKLVTHSLKA